MLLERGLPAGCWRSRSPRTSSWPTGSASRASWTGCAAGDPRRRRRLRHGVLLAGVPAGTAHRRPQARQVVPVRPHRRPPRAGDRPLDDRAGPLPGPAPGRRGRGGRGDAPRTRRRGVRRRAGLALRQGPARRRPRGLAPPARRRAGRRPRTRSRSRSRSRRLRPESSREHPPAVQPRPLPRGHPGRGPRRGPGPPGPRRRVPVPDRPRDRLPRLGPPRGRRRPRPPPSGPRPSATARPGAGRPPRLARTGRPRRRGRDAHRPAERWRRLPQRGPDEPGGPRRAGLRAHALELAAPSARRWPTAPTAAGRPWS